MAARRPAGHLGLILTSISVLLTAVGVIITFLLGVQSSPQVRYRICSYFGLYCTRESEIFIFSVDQPPRAPQIYDDVMDKIYGDAWGKLLSYAGATASDHRCVAGSVVDLRSGSFVGMLGQNGQTIQTGQTVQDGNEFWTSNESQTVARRKGRSLIFDLRVNYSKSRVDQSILVTVKPYYQDHRISQMDTIYKITLPHGKDYATVSCSLPLPAQTGSYRYDFEINDAEDVSDAIVLHKVITITD